MKGTLLVSILMLSALNSGSSEEIRPLPKPRITGQYPLMKLLEKRKTQRKFSPAPLPAQLLSDLLWAAFGVNRPATGGRTAPSAWNHQELDLYVFTAEAVFLYDAKSQALKLVTRKDLRAATGVQDFVGKAPLNIVLIADFDRMPKAANDEVKQLCAAIDAGCIIQNLYLFAAERNLAAVARGSVPRDRLPELLGLRPSQRIIVGMTMGFPQAQ